MENNTDSISLVELCKAFKKNLGIIIIIVCGSLVASFVFTILTPKKYIATATVLSPEMEQQSGKSSMIGGYLGAAVSDMFGGNYSTNVVLSMLKSRKMGEAIINKFNLKDILYTQSTESALSFLSGAATFVVTKEKSINISIESKDPQLSADIANYYVSYLDVMNNELLITTAKPVVRILDRAVPPEHKSKPSLSKNMSIALVVSMVIGFFFVYLKELIRRNNEKAK
ncbi:MAG: hypothetical protein A2452_13425 [Candidatus Firestonebacteria bacterium RIFOXYC2_FULL_39_67]|nr:MAG: hypothetical protein A2536_05275 [Candidatus Firestonebacteria bacterium RIFOXYD2_FULL_39_29]OGF56207.1 MAG: hypothetical protein A2452_13425 [Candidatus Firestonebacteria bacterium RIFOXYC2_FULL_39_67]OGF57286.1 MAG: hypothetical protein A2497_03655 [Candidatus Firestonebacteria bacterium RifOxyC12_full_39_7]